MDICFAVYAHFHKEDERFVKLVTVYSPCFETFYQRFCEDKRRFATYRGFEQTEDPPNTFDVSCLPWTHYRSFDMHVFDKGTYLAPVITWGRYLEKEGRLMLPLSLNLHHAAGDGYHLCRFFFRCGDMDAGFELKEKQRPEKRALFVLWIPLHRLMEKIRLMTSSCCSRVRRLKLTA